MKQIITIIAAILIAFGGKELRVLTVTTTPEMHCQNCEKKIKENIRFEAGVKKIETNLEKQLVVITYDPAKTDSKKLTEAFAKIGYTIKVVSDEPAVNKHKTKKK
jgi:copper chaperone CopZ